MHVTCHFMTLNVVCRDWAESLPEHKYSVKSLSNQFSTSTNLELSSRLTDQLD